jgi:hypothetical protein
MMTQNLLLKLIDNQIDVVLLHLRQMERDASTAKYYSEAMDFVTIIRLLKEIQGTINDNRNTSNWQ